MEGETELHHINEGGIDGASIGKQSIIGGLLFFWPSLKFELHISWGIPACEEQIKIWILRQMV